MGRIERCLLFIPVRRNKSVSHWQKAYATQDPCWITATHLAMLFFVCILKNKVAKKNRDREKIIVAYKLSSQMMIQIKVQTSWKILSRPNYRCARRQIMKLFWIVRHKKKIGRHALIWKCFGRFFYVMELGCSQGNGVGMLSRFCMTHTSLLSGDSLPRGREKHLSINGSQ